MRSKKGEAIILLAHGSREKYPKIVLQELKNKFSQCFQKEKPKVYNAFLGFNKPYFDKLLNNLSQDKSITKILVLPVFISHGKHTLYDVPNIIKSFATRHKNIKIKLAEPLGADDSMVKLLHERYKDIVHAETPLKCKTNTLNLSKMCSD